MLKNCLKISVKSSLGYLANECSGIGLFIHVAYYVFGKFCAAKSLLIGSNQMVAQYIQYAGQGPWIFDQTVLTVLDNLVLVLLGWWCREQRISCARTKDLGTGDYTRAPRPPRGAQPPPCAFSRCSQVHTIGAPWGCAVHCDLCAGHNPSTAWYLGGQNIQTISRNSYPYPNPP